MNESSLSIYTILFVFALTGGAGVMTWWCRGWKLNEEYNTNKDRILYLIREDDRDGIVFVATKYGWYHPSVGCKSPVSNDDFLLDECTRGKIYGYLIQNASRGHNIDEVVTELINWTPDKRSEFLEGVRSITGKETILHLAIKEGYGGVALASLTPRLATCGCTDS